MTTGIDDQLLRDVLAHEAERHDVPSYDPPRVLAGARARRRRRRALVGGAATALAVLVCAVALSAGGLGGNDAERQVVPQGTRHLAPQDTDPSVVLERVPGGRNASALRIPFCELNGDLTGDLLHVDGVAYATDCSYARPHHRYLWYQAGRTVMSSPHGVQFLVGDRLVTLSRLQFPTVRISMDGRYLAWFEEDALVVQDLVAGRRAGTFTMPDEMLSAAVLSVEGVDWSGRTYVLVDDDFWMYDLGLDRWVAVSGLPPGGGADPWGHFSYLTPEGFAVPVQTVSAAERVARSVEGRVTADGVFEPVRTVPLGTAVWSTDRSQVVQLTREGFTTHTADDLGSRVRLDVPVRPADVPAVAWDAQWESGSTVLVTWAVTHGPDGQVSVDDFVTYRCFARTGSCSVLPRDVDVPLSALAHPGG
jgi:hypothetical protein